jgi:NAD(P)-dependent dehydrogenase (short-subunit alcohol dehydrogenase family)
MLKHKKIVIIGGSTGMGLSAANYFLKHGAYVLITGRDLDHVKEAQLLLGENAHAICSDARDENSSEMAIEACINKFHGFDGLYHVAGGSGRKMGDGPLHELSLDGWNKTMDLNLTSLMLSNRAAVKKFLALNQSGTILNMASVLGYSPSPQYFSTHAYAAAKSAIIGFTKSIAAYYAKNNIRINAVAPALVETPMAKRAAEDDAILDYISKKQPLDGGRIGQPSDLDGIALYFMSEQSKFTTGQVIGVDGGWSIS